MHYVEAKHILSTTNGMNLYRGCSHGCIYCDSRSKCYNMNHRFEDIEVKINAPILLEQTLFKSKKKFMIGTGSMGDPYCHIESKLKLTRKCLEIIYKYGYGINIQTKSTRLLEDLDILKKINEKSKTVVNVTLTTSDDELCKILEPNVDVTSKRVEMLKILKDNNIPTIVWLSPFLPFINDTEKNVRKLLNYCIESKVYGIICFDIGLTLREGNREYFYEQLDKYFKGMKQKYIENYKDKYVIGSKNNIKLMKIIEKECKNNNIVFNQKALVEYMHEFPERISQLPLF